MGDTLFDKIWEEHIVEEIYDGPKILYIDLHFIHEVTSPQAFYDIEKRNLPLFRKEKIIATADHNVPTKNQNLTIKDPLSRKQVNLLEENCKKYGIKYYGLGHKYQGIVHVIGPELGFTLPGMTLVCGDSHTSTHGAFGAIAFGIGTSQVAMVMASQCILQKKPKKMRISVEGNLPIGVTSKDVILYIISKIGTDGATGYFVEYAGNIFHKMSMESRMTVCNMSIEMGARGGLIAPDEITFSYIKGRIFAPKNEKFNKAMSYWKSLYSEKDAKFDIEYNFNAENISPMITYGTNPGMAIKITDNIPEFQNKNFIQSLNYMVFKAGESLLNKKIDYVFIGSCTNSRIEDLRIVSKIAKNNKKAKNVKKAIIVPGSQQVAYQARKEGLDKIFEKADFEFRESGCSSCLGMNEDKIPSGYYCVSTSNRNFVGRQGPGVRTLLASPLGASIFAIEGKIVNVQKYLKNFFI